MKTLALTLLLCLLSVSPAFAHPGKTDRYGGHKCLKGCGEWKLYRKEYHLHDKDGRPIRVNKVRKPAAPKVVESAPTVTVEPVISSPVVTTTVTVYRTVLVEQELQTNPFWYALLLLLILLLVVRMNRKREEE